MPSWLTTGAYMLAWLLGIFTIFWTVIRGSSGAGSAKIKIFKTDIELQGQAVFQIFLGAVLIVLPVIVANVGRAQVVPMPSNVQTVDRIDDPKYSAFVFIRDTSVLDLRASLSQPVLKFTPFLIRGHTNPATLVNTMVIRKVQPATTIAFTYATSGRLAARCLTHTCVVRRAVQIDQHAAGKLTETWELAASLDDVEVGQEFTLMTEVTYWNAFDGPDNQWFATYSNAQSEPETVAVALLFPEDKPHRQYQLLRYRHGGTTAEPFQGNSRQISGPGNHSLYWEVFRAEANKSYEVHWTY